MRTSVESINWNGSAPCDAPESLAVGELGIFRYVDADAHDPAGWEVWFGPIVSIEIDSGDTGGEHAIFQVLCQDGMVRPFIDYEVWGETLEEYALRLEEGRALCFYEE